MLARPFGACDGDMICFSIHTRHKEARQHMHADTPLCVLGNKGNMNCLSIHRGARQHAYADAPLCVLKQCMSHLSLNAQGGAPACIC